MPSYFWIFIRLHLFCVLQAKNLVIKSLPRLSAIWNSDLHRLQWKKRVREGEWREWEKKKGWQTGQSLEQGETEHSVCFVYEGRTWHKHWPVCKSILLSFLSAYILNAAFVRLPSGVTLRLHSQLHLPLHCGASSASMCSSKLSTGELWT